MPARDCCSLSACWLRTLCSLQDNCMGRHSHPAQHTCTGAVVQMWPLPCMQLGQANTCTSPCVLPFCVLAHPAGTIHAVLQPLLQAACLLPRSMQLLPVLKLLLQQRRGLPLQQHTRTTAVGSGVSCMQHGGVGSSRPLLLLSGPSVPPLFVWPAAQRCPAARASAAAPGASGCHTPRWIALLPSCWLCVRRCVACQAWHCRPGRLLITN